MTVRALLWPCFLGGLALAVSACDSDIHGIALPEAGAGGAAQPAANNGGVDSGIRGGSGGANNSSASGGAGHTLGGGGSGGSRTEGSGGTEIDAGAADGASPGGGSPGSAEAGSTVPNLTTVGCGRPRQQVSVGGVEGFDSFVDARHSARLRACGASLYVHQVGWNSLANDQARKQVAANFGGTGGISLEMAEATDLTHDYFDLGIASISEILVNAPTCEVPGSDDTIDVWRGWVEKWRARGILRAEYNDTPNCHFPVDWSSATWDASRERAKLGGGVVLDSPPFFYYDVSPPDYRAFVRAEIAWANANGLHSSWILSPGEKRDFLADTKRLIAEINALLPAQRPQQWIVESYGAGGPVGDENVAGSVANVALWVVENAETYVP